MKPDLSLKIPSKRIWELDLLKGIALIIMILDHTIFDLSSMFNVDISSVSFIDTVLSPIAAALFMIICGISITFGRHNIKRGSLVFSLGMVITLVTYIAGLVMHEELLICFGILHFLGISMILGHYIKRLPIIIDILLIICIIIVSRLFININPSTNILFPLGIYNARFFSSDYFPIFPNLAYVVFGIVLGKTIYKNKRTVTRYIPKKSVICCIGRNTLIIYMIHQPIILLVLNIIYSIR